MNAKINTVADFNIGHIYKGARAGMFVVVAMRTLGGEAGMQVKPYNHETGKAMGGEMFFTPDMLIAA